MLETYHKQYSPRMGRDMEHAVIGHGGKVCLAFAPQDGHTYDFGYGLGWNGVINDERTQKYKK